MFDKRIEEILTHADLKPDRDYDDLVWGLNQIKGDLPVDVYKQLGGVKDWRGILPNRPDFKVGRKYVKIDGAGAFNRYRLQTLRIDLYLETDFFDVNSYRRNCRRYEKECIKSAANRKNWTSELAEAHFGKAVEPGEFYSNGSPLWKMRAFRDFLTDHHFWASEISFARISIYDNVMIDKKLMRLDQLLIGNNKKYDKLIEKFLIRRLGIDQTLRK
jgi:hypothetical protein